jgi:hypothetical protein
LGNNRQNEKSYKTIGIMKNSDKYLGKDSEPEDKISQTLKSFENIEPIESSSDWEKTLMDKISASKSNPEGLNITSPKFMVMIVTLIAVNIGFVANVLNNSSKDLSKPSRDTDLQQLSKELFTGTTSTKN